MVLNPGAKALKKNFTLLEKYDIIRCYEEETTRVKDLQAKFGCGKTQIYRMIKQRDEIKQEYLSGTKNPKTKRSVKCTPNNETNTTVLRWYREMKRRGEKVSGTALKAKAREVGESLGLIDFKASNGWLQSFQYRNNISLSGNKSNVSQYSTRNSTASPIQPISDPLHTDQGDILSVLDETPVDGKNFGKLEKIILKEKSSEYDNADVCTACETVLYYNTLPDDATGPCTDQLTILFCYYNDGNYEKPLITLNETNLSKVRKQFFNNFIVKSNATGLLTFQFLAEYLITLNSKLMVNNRHIILRLDNKFDLFTFENLSNIELIFEPTNNIGSIITDFKLYYRNLMLNAYIPFACNNTKKLTFSKNFHLNDAIKLILKSIGNMDFSSSNDGGGRAANMRSELYDKMVICKFSNSSTDNYLNVDAVDIVYHADELNDDDEDNSDDEDKIISLSKATVYLIEIKKMLMLRGDERLIDKVDELQSDLNEMCFEEERLNLI